MSQGEDEAGVLEIGVARAYGAEDNSVVATRMVRAGGCGVDGHDMTRRSQIGAGR